MDRLVELKRNGEEDPLFGREISEKNVPRRSRLDDPDTSPVEGQPARADVAADNPLFTPPFVGSRVAVGIPLDDIAEYLNLTALFRNQWGFRPENGENDTEFKDRVRATLREQLGKAKEADLLVPSVAYGHFAANAEGNDLVIWKDESRSSEWMRFTFPRQRKEPWLCIADFFRTSDSGDEDFASFMLCTIGARASEETARLFAENHYQEYLFLHGLSVEMAEATAEYWHHRVREELGFVSRGRADPDRTVPPAVPGRALLLGLSGLPGPDGQCQGRGAAGRGPHRRDGERGVPAQPRTDDRRHHLPPPRGQVLRGVRPARSRPSVTGAPVACGLVLGLVLVLGPTALGTAGAAPPATNLEEVVISTLGPGYAATPQGPLDPSAFASNAPNPSAAVGALSTLPASVAPDEREWQADGGLNQVRDLLVRFPNVAGARAFLHVAQHSLESGEIVDSNAVPSIPGARRVTYFTPTKQGGVGEAVTMRAGVYVDLLFVLLGRFGQRPTDGAGERREGGEGPVRSHGEGARRHVGTSSGTSTTRRVSRPAPSASLSSLSPSWPWRWRRRCCCADGVRWRRLTRLWWAPQFRPPSTRQPATRQAATCQAATRFDDLRERTR